MFYGELLDAEISVFVVVVLIGLLLLRRLRLAPEMRLPLIALGLAAVLMPNWLLSTWGADFRLPPLLAMLAVAATRPELKSSRVATILVTLAVVLFGARVVTVTDSWRAFDRDAAELRAAASRIDEGARILVVRERKRADPDDRQIVRRLYWYLAALTVIDRAAFLPFLFTDPEKQPLIVAPAYREIDTPYGHPIWLADLREGADPLRADRILGTSDNRGRYRYWAYWPYKFDYVLFLHFAPQDNPLPERLAPVSRGSFFDIYRVVRPGN